MALPLDTEGLVKVLITARGVDVRAEADIDGEPPQVHVYLYFWDLSELEDAIETMATYLDSVSLRILVYELAESMDNVDIELLIRY